MRTIDWIFSLFMVRIKKKISSLVHDPSKAFVKFYEIDSSFNHKYLCSMYNMKMSKKGNLTQPKKSKHKKQLAVDQAYLITYTSVH